ncbi:MAG TPA: hypothetical protein VLC09_19115 [Polyangiaceae bacterium]|nr:hypothetical protein [Polyangiaceae bacterium]
MSCTPNARPTPPPNQTPSAVESTRAAPLPAWIADTDQMAVAAGAGPAQLLESGAGVPGDALGGLISIPAGRCALLYVRGTPSLEDLDLLAFGEDGSELGGDEAPDAHPTVVLCPEAEQRVHVSARVVQGRGLLSLVVHDVPKSQADDVRRSLAPGRSHGRRNESWPGSEAALSEHRQVIGGTWIDSRRVALPVDARLPSRLSASVPAHGCLDALALASPEVAQLELDVLDEGGRIFARGANQGDHRWSVVCASEEATEVSFEVRPLGGRGLVLFVLSTTPSNFAAPLSGAVFPKGLPARALVASKTELPPAKDLLRANLAVGEYSSAPLTFEGCARLELVPEDPLWGFEARVWSKTGELLAEAKGLAARPMVACLPPGGARLDLTAERRAGALSVQLGAAKRAPSELASLPLALSRLLSEQADGSTAWLDSPPQLHRVELSRDRLTRAELTVPAGRCLRVAAAPDLGVHGVELRLRESGGEREISTTRGATSAGLGVCAEAGHSRTVRLELRAIEGQGSAIWTAQPSR